MTVWEKIRQGFFGGAATLSEKTVELTKTGMDILKEHSEKAAAKALFASKLAMLNSQIHSASRSMESQYMEIGSSLFKLHSENRLFDLEKETGRFFEQLLSLEKEIEKYQNEKNELANFYKLEKLEIESIRQLTNDLEDGGGTILQVVLKHDSSCLGKSIKNINLPEDVLVGTIVRDGKIIIPDGETIFQHSDKITILGKKTDVEKTIALMNSDDHYLDIK